MIVEVNTLVICREKLLENLSGNMSLRTMKVLLTDSILK